MSPYGDKFLDIRFPDGVYGSLTVSIEEGIIYSLLWLLQSS